VVFCCGMPAFNFEVRIVFTNVAMACDVG
jgi:hypothetical protein